MKKLNLIVSFAVMIFTQSCTKGQTPQPVYPGTAPVQIIYQSVDATVDAVEIQALWGHTGNGNAGYMDISPRDGRVDYNSYGFLIEGYQKVHFYLTTGQRVVADVPINMIENLGRFPQITRTLTFSNAAWSSNGVIPDGTNRLDPNGGIVQYLLQ